MDVTQVSPPHNRLMPTAKSVTMVVADPAPRAAPARAGVALTVALVLLGGGLRTAALATDRNLWIDESMLALNLVNRPPARLFDKLDWNQGAPVGFLLAVKASIGAFGASEWALRLVPFLLSVAGLAGFAVVARRLLPAGGALLAIGLFAASPHLINYAAECKQYAGDAAFAIGLLTVSLGLLEGKGGGPRWAGLAVAGAAVVWCSHPSVFVLGGIGTALLARAAVGRDRPTFVAAALTVGAWLVSFAACYLICLKQLGGNKYLTDYWAGHFMALPPRGLGDLAWLVDHAVAFFTVPGGFGGSIVPLGGFAAALALVGLREFGRERWPLAVALSVPAGLVLLASGLHKYPVGGRLMLFAVPFAVLLVARGLWAAYDGLAAEERVRRDGATRGAGRRVGVGGVRDAAPPAAGGTTRPGAGGGARGVPARRPGVRVLRGDPGVHLLHARRPVRAGGGYARRGAPRRPGPVPDGAGRASSRPGVGGRQPPATAMRRRTARHPRTAVGCASAR
jgi:hypothetical protein